MKKRKFFLIALALIMSTCFLFAFVGCSEKTDCTHEWQNTSVRTEATCTTVGSQEQKCTKCGDTQTVEISALGHNDEGAIAHEDATCTEDGVVGGSYCTRCNDGKAAAEKVIPALNHIDEDENHKCDFCEKDLSDCIDSDRNHECDVCKEPLGAHKAAEGSHVCSYCDQTASECEDEDGDHDCDACGATMTSCADENKDHKCDVCKTEMGEHTPMTETHICGYCNQKASDCEDKNNDHLCDTCESKVSDHTGGKATCQAKAICDVCHDSYGALGEHDFSGVWSSDEKEHSRACQTEGCTEQTKPENHSFEKGVCLGCETNDTFGTDGITYTYNGADGYAVSKYSGTAEHIRIPYFHDDGVNGLKRVLSIDDQVFSQRSSMRTVELTGIKTIGRKAFYYCSKLESINLDGELTTIRSYAFEASGLKSITIGDNVTLIEAGAFSSCTSCETVTLGRGLTLYNVKDHAFSSCFRIRKVINKSSMELKKGDWMACGYIGKYALSITKTAEEEPIFSVNGYQYLKSNKLYLVGYEGDATSLILPSDYNGETYEIASYAFADNAILTEVTIPKNIVKIGVNAFKGCSVLERVYFAKDSQLKTIPERMFDNCNALKEVLLPDGLTEIGKNAFDDCKALTGIVLPETLEKIGQGAFGYSGLKSIYIPDSVTTLEWDAFTYTSSLETVVFGENCQITEFASDLFAVSGIKSITIPASVTKIESSAFRDSSLTTITIPAWVTELGESAFSMSDELESVYFAADSKITKIPDNAFSACGGLKEVFLPASVTEIGKEAFFNSTLQSIVLPSGLLKIGEAAFATCWDLPEIVVPSTVTEIGLGAFRSCRKMKKVTLPGGITEVPKQLFAQSYALSRVYFDGTEAQWVSLIAEDNTTWNYNTAADFAVVCTDTQSLVAHHAAKAATCAEDGNVEYWHEEIGNTYYTDEECTQQTTKAAVTIPAIRHSNKKHVAAGKHTCYAYGHIKYWTCGDCGKKFSDALCTMVITETIEWNDPPKCDVVWVAPTEATCSTYGRFGFWDCENCYRIYADEECKKLITSGVTDYNAPPTHKNVVRHDSTPPTCTERGTLEYWECQICNAKFKDEALTVKISSIVDYDTPVLGHKNLETLDGIAATCASAGRIAHKRCLDCDRLFDTRGYAVTKEEVTIDPIGHKNKVEKKNCLQSGFETYLYCPDCKTNYTDESCSEVKTIAIAAFECHGFTLGVCDVCELKDTFGSAGLSYEYNYRSYTLTGYTGSAERVRIPFYYAGEEGVYPITWAKGDIFRNNTALVSIDIGARISISDRMFSGCTNLSEVITYYACSIGASAFENCANLKKIEFAATSGRIGGSAFSGSGLTEISLGESTVTTIELCAFTETKIEKIVLPNTLKRIGNHAFYNCTLLTEADLPEGLERIEQSAFAGTAIKKVVAPSSLQNIEFRAFSGCTELTEVTIGSGVQKIWQSAFEDCTKLTTLTFEEGFSELDSYVFEGCSLLSSVTIPASLTKLSSCVFKDCESLKTVVILSDLKEIPTNTFRGCASLTDITIPENLETIGYAAFKDCVELEKIVLPSSLSKIEGSAFSGCRKLATIDVTYVDRYDWAYTDGTLAHTKLTSLEGSAFYDCASLTDVSFPETVTQIPGYAFYGCTSLLHVVLPETVTKIGASAFNGCSALVSIQFGGTESAWVNMEKGLDWNKGLPENSKMYYTNVKYSWNTNDSVYYVVYHESYRTITHARIAGRYNDGVHGESDVYAVYVYAFKNCTTLESVVIEQNSRAGYCIWDQAFAGCTNLTYVELAANLATMTSRIFENCNKLTQINFKGTKAQWEKFPKSDNVFYGAPKGLTVYCEADGTTVSV